MKLPCGECGKLVVTLNPWVVQKCYQCQRLRFEARERERKRIKQAMRPVDVLRVSTRGMKHPKG